MMLSAVTLCMVPESSAGPFVFHGDLGDGFRKAAEHGFDAVELFLPGPAHVKLEEVRRLQAEYGLVVAAVGTGAGMVKHRLSLTDPDPSTRNAARIFLREMIRFGGELGAPAILGSMQGRCDASTPRAEALGWLADALREASDEARKHGVKFIYEPLNRYETNLFNTASSASGFLKSEQISNVVLLADLFHMAIEERDIADSLRSTGDLLGHVHWADSNRHAMGYGHTDVTPIANALIEIGYGGYLSAEVLPLPDADAAAARPINSIREAFR